VQTRLAGPDRSRHVRRPAHVAERTHQTALASQLLHSPAHPPRPTTVPTHSQ